MAESVSINGVSRFVGGEMKTIQKQLIKLEGLIERRDAPRLSEILRERYTAIRAAQGLPPLAPQNTERGLSMAEILRQRLARAAESGELGSEGKALDATVNA